MLEWRAGCGFVCGSWSGVHGGERRPAESKVSVTRRGTNAALRCALARDERGRAGRVESIPALKADGTAPFGLGAQPAPLLDEADGEPLLHVVFVSPQIHWNTGNIGRTCLGMGARLHVVGPLGFSLDDKHVRRAGLDYWDHVDLRVYPSWDDFVPILETFKRRLYFTKYASSSMLDVDFADEAHGKTALIFGSEIDGLTSIRPWLVEHESARNMIAYPMNAPEVFRSYNLSTSASMALWDAYKTLTRLRRPSTSIPL